MVRHSCLGCYSGDIGYIKNCHHYPDNRNPCSLWLFRGGKVHKDEVPILKFLRGYAVGMPAGDIPNVDRRIIEVFLYIQNGKDLLMLRWIPQKKNSITPTAAAALAQKAYDSIWEDGTVSKGWEIVPDNEG